MTHQSSLFVWFPWYNSHTFKIILLFITHHPTVSHHRVIILYGTSYFIVGLCWCLIFAVSACNETRNSRIVLGLLSWFVGVFTVACCYQSGMLNKLDTYTFVALCLPSALVVSGLCVVSAVSVHLADWMSCHQENAFWSWQNLGKQNNTKALASHPRCVKLLWKSFVVFDCLYSASVCSGFKILYIS
jgi:hypothetical protein